CTSCSMNNCRASASLACSYRTCVWIRRTRCWRPYMRFAQRSGYSLIARSRTGCSKSDGVCLEQIGRSFRCSLRGTSPLHQIVQQRQEQQGKERGNNDPADDNCRQWALTLCAGARRKRHRNKTECRDCCSHYYWPQTRQRSFQYSGADIASLFPQLIEIADHHATVEHGHATQGDETDSRRNTERHVPQPEGDDPTSDSEWHARVNQ